MDAPRPRLCHLRKWPDFNGYGFNLHAEKGKAGQYIGSIDPQSPSDAAGLRAGDRIVEVNGVNIGSENHQQVVQRIKAVASETRLLVVDPETDAYFRGRGLVVRGDGDVIHLETPVRNPYTAGGGVGSEEEGEEVNGGGGGEHEGREEGGAVFHAYEPVIAPDPPRLCLLRRWLDFDGFGFNLHSEKGKPGQYIGNVDDFSPSTAAGLRRGDWIVEVNGADVTSDLHPEVVTRIKAKPNEVAMLVVSPETRKFYGDRGVKVVGEMPGVVRIECPRENPNSASVNGGGVHSAMEEDAKSSQGYSDTASVGRDSHTSADTSQYEGGRMADRRAEEEGGRGGAAGNQAMLHDVAWKGAGRDPAVAVVAPLPVPGARSSTSSAASSSHSSHAPSGFFSHAPSGLDPAAGHSPGGYRDPTSSQSPRIDAASSGFADGAASSSFQADAASSGYASGNSSAGFNKSDAAAKSSSYSAGDASGGGPSGGGYGGHSAPSFGSQSSDTSSPQQSSYLASVSSVGVGGGVEKRQAPSVPPMGGGEKSPPPMMVGGLEFASSAKEAREKGRIKKRDVAKMANMTLKDKYDLLQKL